jgi:hypothetical protein
VTGLASQQSKGWLHVAKGRCCQHLPLHHCCPADLQVRRSAVGHLCLFIFIAPPSHAELERRLRNRGTESEEKVLQRLSNAEAEIAKAQVGSAA